MRERICLFSVLLLSLSALSAQPAPRDTASVEIAGRKVAVEYGRPSLKGRTFDELAKGLPADRIWRAGSESVTTLTTEVPLLIGGKTVVPGKYSLYVHLPESGDYSLIINRNQGIPLGEMWDQAPAAIAKDPYPSFDYEQQVKADEVVRAPLKRETSAGTVEQFTISLEPSGRGATMTLAWGDQLWSLDLLPAPMEGSGMR